MALEGKSVLLREERSEDMPFLLGLRNDLETQAWSQTLPPDFTLGMYLKRFEGREFSFERSDGRFVVVEKESGQLVGAVIYSELTSRWDLILGVMVAKKFWGSGYAIDALETLLRFVFEELGVRVVRLWTHSGNPRAIGSAEKLGFTLSIRQREAIFKGGQMYDNIGMDMLREEYYARHPELTDCLPGL